MRGLELMLSARRVFSAQIIDRIDRAFANPAVCGVFPRSMPLVFVDRRPGFIDRADPGAAPILGPETPIITKEVAKRDLGAVSKEVAGWGLVGDPVPHGPLNLLVRRRSARRQRHERPQFLGGRLMPPELGIQQGPTAELLGIAGLVRVPPEVRER